MRVIRNSLPAGERVVALGTFDGVHLGHARLIHSAKMLSANMDAPLRVCTFDRHPLEVLRPDNLLSMLPGCAAFGWFLFLRKHLKKSAC